MMLRVLVLAAALVAAMPAVQAQDPATYTEMVVTAGASPTVDPNGTGSLPVSVQVGCAVLLSNPTTSAVTVTSPDAADAALDVEAAELAVSPAACAGATPGVVTISGNLTVAPRPDAKGMVPLALTLVAQLGGASAEGNASVVVGYRAGHTFTPADGATFEVRNGTHTFEVVEQFTGNARSMIMFEEYTFDGGGSLSPMPLLIRDPPVTERFNVTFTAPAGDWDEVKVSFKSYSHYIDPASGQGSPDQHYVSHPVWTFRNADPPRQDDDDAPGAGILVAFALLAAAAFTRRR